MKKIIAIIAFIISVVVISLSFIDTTYVKSSENLADITYSINSIPKTLKTVGNLSKRQQDIICATSKGLIDIDENGEIVPSLAQSVEIKEDGLKYEFTLRDDINWSDGSKITSEDVVEFFREVILHENKEDIEVFFDIFGATEYRDGNESFKDTVAVSSEENKVIIKLNKKNSDFLFELSKPQYKLRDRVLLWDDIKYSYVNLKYSGDYTISNIEDSEIFLSRSKSSDSNLVKTIHMQLDENEDLALASFEVGSTDIVINPPSSELQRLYNEDKLVTSLSDEGMYLGFNPNDEDITTGYKKEIYRFISKAVDDYQAENQQLIELSDGKFFKNKNENLEKLQSRKVNSNLDTYDDEIKSFKIIAEDNLKNKDLLNFIEDWFYENTDIQIYIDFVKKEDIDNIETKSYYDAILLDLSNDKHSRKEFFTSIFKYLNDNLKDFVKNNKNSNEEELFLEIEDAIFNSYSVLPLAFYNDNIAISSDIKDINFDNNGNIVFDNIKK